MTIITFPGSFSHLVSSYSFRGFFFSIFTGLSPFVLVLVYDFVAFFAKVMLVFLKTFRPL